MATDITNKIRIVLIDDQKLFREGVAQLIENDPSMTVLGQAGSVQTAVSLVAELKPDVVISEAAFSGSDSSQLCRSILEESPATRIIILTRHSGSRFGKTALESGASGYLLKSSGFEELAEAIRVVMKGQVYLSPNVTGSIINELIFQENFRGDAEKKKPLSRREVEVIRFVSNGMPSKKIAQTLHLSTRTVDAHRQRIMIKLDIDSVAGLTKYALREGLTTLD